jgi:hypothetical protein
MRLSFFLEKVLQQYIASNKSINNIKKSQLLSSCFYIIQKGNKSFLILQHSKKETFISTVMNNKQNRYNMLNIEPPFLLVEQCDDEEDIFNVSCPDFPGCNYKSLPLESSKPLIKKSSKEISHRSFFQC